MTRLLALAAAVVMAGAGGARAEDVILFSPAQSNWLARVLTNLTMETPLSSIASSNAYTLASRVQTAPDADRQEIARQLAADGVVCKVFGHWWPESEGGNHWVWGEGVPLSSDLWVPQAPVLRRTCRLCGRVEEQTTEWREVR